MKPIPIEGFCLLWVLLFFTTLRILYVEFCASCIYNKEKGGDPMAKLSDPITILKGIGPSKAKQFENLNIFTLRDLICHFPRGYEDRTKLVPIEKLEPDKPA